MTQHQSDSQIEADVIRIDIAMQREQQRLGRAFAEDIERRRWDPSLGPSRPARRVVTGPGRGVVSRLLVKVLGS